MRRTIPSLAVALIAGLLALTVSQARSQSAPPANRSVLVLPFSNVSGTSEAWMGKAVQQDLLTDLTQGTTAQVLAPAGLAPAADADEALHAARDKGASIVIYGQTQAIGKEIRLTGQVLDVATGKSIGQLKATGPSDGLFHLEDALASQVFMAFPRDLLTGPVRQGLQTATASMQNGQPQQPQAGWPSGPYAESTTNPNPIYVAPQVAPPVSDEQPNYTYNYYDTTPDTGYYPDYGYGYGYGDAGLWPYWDGLGFYVSPGWGYYGYGRHFGYGRGGYGRGAYGYGGHYLNGGGRSAVTGLRSGSSLGGFARSNLGAGSFSRGALGGFHASATSGFRAGGGALRGGGFHSSSIGGGFHGGGFSGGGFHGGGGGRR